VNEERGGLNGREKKSRRERVHLMQKDRGKKTGLSVAGVYGQACAN
jgi:hypothetical protein